MGRPLNGYDLPTAVAAMLEELDGQPPAPAHYAVTGPVPGSLDVQADRRGPVAIVVGMVLRQISGAGLLSYRANLKVGDYTFMEGVTPIEVLREDIAVPTALLSPIRLDPSTPIKMLVSMLPGEVAQAGEHTLSLQVLYGSVRAADAVMEAFGEARWWTAYAPKGGTIETTTLTVQIGGRPTYVRTRTNTGPPEVSVQLDGRTLTPQPIMEQLSGTAFLPHEVRVGQVYQWQQATGGAGVGRAFWSFHGPAAPR